MRLLLRNLENRLRKHRVGPCKPRPGVVADFVDVDRLVHKSKTTRVEDEVDALCDFRVRVCGHCLDEKGHGPGIFKADYR